MNLIPIRCFVAVVLLLLATTLQAGVPALLEVPAYLPKDRQTTLTAERATLTRRIATLRRWAADYNARYGGRDVPAGDPRVAESATEKARLDAAGRAYVRDAQAFNERLLAITAIASVADATGDVQVTTPDGRTLRGAMLGRCPLNTGTRIQTGADGQLRAKLADGAVLTIGANAALVIDDYSYDPDPSLRQVTASFAHGVFRWIGTQAHRLVGGPAELRVRTPAIAVAVRGTDFELTVRPDHSGEVKLFAGAVSVTPAAGGESVTLEPGQYVTFTATGRCHSPQPLPLNAPTA